MGVDDGHPRLPVLDESDRPYEHPLYGRLLSLPGLSVGVTAIDTLLTWGMTNSQWIFPMATSCCGIELMAAAASRVDLDRMGTILRGTPRQCDVMVVAGTITVKMAPRVKRLWEQMPEPKWAVAMGSCAISGDFYRELYPVVPGIDTFLPVDVYIPGCPPNPESLMAGMLALAEKVRGERGRPRTPQVPRLELLTATKPSVARIGDLDRSPAQTGLQEADAMKPSDSPIARPTPAEPSAAEAEVARATLSGTSLGPELEALFAEHGATEIPKDAPPLIPAGRHLALAAALKARGYSQLVYVVGSHWPAGKGRSGAAEGEAEHYEVAYGLRTVGRGSKLVWWSVRVPADGSVPSLAAELAGADWQEREQWDLVGVRFSGHPDLRRLMMPDDWQGHPLRKDYAADTHTKPWR